MKFKKYFLMALLGTFVFTACENDKDDTNNQQDMAKLEERLPGNWSLVAVQYSGLAPNPYDSTQQFPFNGDATEVSGYFKFTEEPNMLDFEMNWKGQVDFGGGTTLTIPVSEQGQGFWEVDIPSSSVVGDAWGFAGNQDTVPAVWKVIENYPNKQVWSTTTSFEWDGFDIPVDVDLKTTFVK